MKKRPQQLINPNEKYTIRFKTAEKLYKPVVQVVQDHGCAFI